MFSVLVYRLENMRFGIGSNIGTNIIYYSE